MNIINNIKKIFNIQSKEEINKHEISSNIFREYDIRGVFDENIFLQDAFNIGRAFGTMLIKHQLKTVCVGYDCRLSSAQMANNLINGLISSGVEVISLGVCHTPLMYYAVHKLGCDAGIMTTGSHNPPDHNGFKFMFGVNPFYGESLKELERNIRDKDFVEGVGREVVLNNVLSQYITDLLKGFDFDAELRVAWDIGNGATSNAIKSIVTLIAGHHHVIFEEMDGNFPNRPPDPMHHENVKYLKKFIINNGFDIGFAFDSDGDRLCVINSSGEILFSDQVLSVLAADFLSKNPGAQVIADVKSCNKLFESIQENGGIGIMERVGHSFIKAKMKSTGALLAGEMSGHFFFKDRWFGFDDGIYAALRCLEILSKDKDAFSNMDYGFVTPEIRVACSDIQKKNIIKELKQKMIDEKKSFSAIDGIRVSCEIGWWLLRASNTQNAISLRVEGNSEKSLNILKNEISNYLEPYIPGIKNVIFI